MLVAIRGRVARLKADGRSLDEIVAAKPTAEFDAKWVNSSSLRRCLQSWSIGRLTRGQHSHAASAGETTVSIRASMTVGSKAAA
jgi:hypothetical protein